MIRLIQFWQGFKRSVKDMMSDLPNATQVGWFSGVLCLVVIVGAGLFGSIFLLMAVLSRTGTDTPRTYPYSGQIHWERYDGGVNSDIYRVRTPHGWLVMTYGEPVYIPDENGTWTIDRSGR